jgi:ribonucleoside-triphosphate reductase
MDFMNGKLMEYQEETGNYYNLEATPAESTAYRLASKDKKFFPQIICANNQDYKQGAECYYTNSAMLPINYTDDIFEYLDLQDEIQSKYTGGTVVHLYAGERITNFGVVKNLVKKICDNYTLPYFSFTPTFSICANHGYINGEHNECPQCGEHTEVYSRVVGYIRPVSDWNKSKRQEFVDRKTFKVN